MVCGGKGPCASIVLLWLCLLGRSGAGGASSAGGSEGPRHCSAHGARAARAPLPWALGPATIAQLVKGTGRAWERNRERGKCTTLELRGGSDLAQCRFEVKVGEGVRQGSTLVLVRSGGALPITLQDPGVSEVVEMREDPGGDGWWLTELAVPVGDTVRFKFAIRGPDGQMSWEPGLDRHTTIPDEFEPVLSFSFGDASAPASDARKHKAGLLGGLAVVLRLAYGRLPALLVSVSDAVGGACRRCPALIAHAPLAALLVWDLSQKHAQGQGEVRVVMRRVVRGGRRA